MAAPDQTAPATMTTPPAQPLPSHAETQPRPAAATPVSVPPEERAKYMRTMAKDMASLSQAASAAVPAPAPAAKPAAEPSSWTSRDEHETGVRLPETEEPFFDQSASHPKEWKPETVDLPSMAEAGDILAKREQAPANPAPAAVPMMPQAAVTPPMTAAPVDQERESILARLRRKMEEERAAKAMPAPEPAPAAPIPARNEWPDIPAPAPAFVPLAVPEEPKVPSTIEEAPAPEIPTPAPFPTKTNPAPQGGLHTYSSDFLDHANDRGASRFSVLAAEQDARAARPRSAGSGGAAQRALVSVAIGILLIALAGGGVYATYRFVMTMKNTPIASISVPSTVFADSYKELHGGGAILLASLASASEEPLPADQIKVTYVSQTDPSGKGSALSSPADGSVLFKALSLPIPDLLLRNISSDSTIGIIHAGDETRPFFALGVDSYERTYAGMLTWEPLMERDLISLYPLYQPADVPAPTVASSTATTTVALTTFHALPAKARTRFEDAVIANHDVRALYDTDGRTLLLYGYTSDKSTLLIARDETAFRALLGRLKPAK